MSKRRCIGNALHNETDIETPECIRRHLHGCIGRSLISLPVPLNPPDGEWVAFYSLVQPEGHLYLAHPDGTGLRQVTNDAAIDRLPRLSPDEKWIACFSNRSGPPELWKIRPDGSDLQQFTEGGGSYLAWSPDGSRISTVGAIEQASGT